MVKVPPSISATRDFLVACLLRELRQLHRQLDDIFLVHVADHRNQQAAIGIRRDADMDVLLVDDFFFLHIDGGVELRKYFERCGADFQSNRGHGHLAAGLFGLGSETRPQVLEFRDVGAVMLRDVGDRVPGFGEMFGGFAANPAHGNALDFSPLGEIGQLGCDEMSGARRSLGGTWLSPSVRL